MMGVATRLLDSTHSTVTTGDECLMIFQGFLTFRDEVKASAGPALRSLMENGVAVKVGRLAAALSYSTCTLSGKDHNLDHIN